MGKTSKPRAGSIAYYPRVRAKTEVPRFKVFKETKIKEGVKILNFYGYKAGMLHVMATNKHKGSALNNQRISIPSTIVEFPSLTVFGVRFYVLKNNNKSILKDFIFSSKADVELKRKVKSMDKYKEKGDLLKKANELFEKNKAKLTDVVLMVHTNPKKTTIGKKKPEIVELYLAGELDAKFDYFREKLGKGIDIDEAFEPNTFLDAKSVTIGKGFQGVIKRHGVKRRHHKSEKGVRRVGSIGPWHPAVVMWTVPRPGQMGYHTRTLYNLKLLTILNPEELKSKAGLEGYGQIRNKVMIIAGSVGGPVKRLVTFREGMRPKTDIRLDVGAIENIVLK
jgi:large subunit ribosomal protein L3